MTKDWESQVEEEKEKGRIMQTRAKDTCNSRYYIICKMKQLLNPFSIIIIIIIVIIIIHLYKTVFPAFQLCFKDLETYQNYLNLT